MEKIFSTMNDKRHIKHGDVIQTFKCNNCNTSFNFKITYKNYISKKLCTECPNCKNKYEIGDIFNFEYGNKLGNPLPGNISQEKYDKYIWKEKV